MKDRICPVMAQGYIANPNQSSMKNQIEAIKNLPGCLKENCALWIITSFSDSSGKHESGHCGLINIPREEPNSNMW